MSARRAALLTLLVVVVIAAVAAAGFFGYRGYDRAQGRADDAEARAEQAEARAEAARNDYTEGVTEGTKNALSFAGLDKPGWYVVEVTTGPTRGVQPADVNVVSKM